MRMWFYCPNGCQKTSIAGTGDDPPNAWGLHCEFCEELLTTDPTEYDLVHQRRQFDNIARWAAAKFPDAKVILILPVEEEE